MKQDEVQVDCEGWIHCPVCGRKSRTKIKEDTVLRNFSLYCAKCGNETLINLNRELQTEPDAKTQSR